jgi:hypothetical protein
MGDRNPSFFGSVPQPTAAGTSAFSIEELAKIDQRRREDDARRADLDLASAKDRCEPMLLAFNRAEEPKVVVVRVRASDKPDDPEVVELVTLAKGSQEVAKR